MIQPVPPDIRSYFAPTANTEHSDSLSLALLNTPVGALLAGATTHHLVLLDFAYRKAIRSQVQRVQAAFPHPVEERPSALLQETARQLAAYFSGSLHAFDLPLQVPATPFQEAVWQALQRIPYGETRTYAELARQVASPGGAVAAGQANGANRIAIVIPCHRIVATGGGLGGYAGGLPAKRRLLTLEGARIQATAGPTLF